MELEQIIIHNISSFSLIIYLYQLAIYLWFA